MTNLAGNLFGYGSVQGGLKSLSWLINQRPAKPPASEHSSPPSRDKFL